MEIRQYNEIFGVTTTISLPMDILLEIVDKTPLIHTKGAFACCSSSLRKITQSQYPEYVETVGKGYPSNTLRKATNVVLMAKAIGIQLGLHCMADGDFFYDIDAEQQYTCILGREFKAGLVRKTIRLVK
jgi:hypothetical protein